MQLTTLHNLIYKSLRWTCIVMFVLLAFNSNAQDTTDIQYTTAVSISPSADTAKIDSFYQQKSIDIKTAGNLSLYFEVYRWYRTCYRYGGNSDHGIDCSHFVNMLYEKLYGITLGPSAGAILTQCKIVKKGLSDVREGDVLFFKIKKGQVSHVGIYLQNNKFAHASTHAGVIISDMNEPYYKKRFYKVGRVLQASE
jgi:murein DD-endopeptidase / murein LD-carboxypeptidase